MYYQEEFTKEEEAILLNHFTNIDKPVFCLINMPEVVKGALYARYSRSPKSLRRLFLDEFWNEDDKFESIEIDSSKAEKLYERVFTQYGDDSVAQLGAAHLACEQASNLLTKVLEWGRIASYLEQSTRYIYYDQKMGDSYRYMMPKEFRGSSVEKDYIKTMDNTFETYSELVRTLVEIYKKEFPKEEGISMQAYNGTIRAKACDVARYFLPTSTLSNVGIFASGQAYEQLLMRMRVHPASEVRDYADMILEELRKVIPSFLKRVDVENRGVEWSNYLRDNQVQTQDYVSKNISNSISDSSDVNLIEWEEDAEKKITAYCLYSSSQKSLSDLKEIVSSFNSNEVREVLCRYTGHRKNRRHKPGRAFENSYYTFDILSDYGAFRDLQRHRLMTIEWQKMSPKNGFDMPSEVDKSGLIDKCLKIVDDSIELHNKINDNFPELREYALLFGHKIRYSMTLNVRQAFHLIELRTAKQGHISYRDICQKMHNLIRDKAGHGIFYELMSYVDHENYELQRLDSEIKQSSKEKN
ncbi:MAG: FAD-dependent thymidylate synthase [Chloroflexota bacterium]|nr:FAD-dependent thymidylate synthase [Chloroflexota bacterium]